MVNKIVCLSACLITMPFTSKALQMFMVYKAVMICQLIPPNQYSSWEVNLSLALNLHTM